MFEQFENATGFIFDCDGCLLDSMDAWRYVEYALIDASHHEWTQPQLEEMRAATMTDAARIFHERYGVMASNEAVIAFMHETMWDYYTTKAQLKPGVWEFLNRLHERCIPCCVVSSTAGKYLKAGLAHAGISDLLASIFSTQGCEMSKQNPELYRMALATMEAEPASAWGFDDSLYAIRVMNGVGMRTVGTYDADDAGSFEQLGDTATLAIRSFEELLA